MLQIVLVTLPFFALIAAGWAATRSGTLPVAAIPGLNVFVLYFALPCMLFRFGAGAPIAALLDGGVAVVWGVCALLMVGVAVAVARWQHRAWNDAAFGALVATFPNTGFMGVPLLVALLGDAVASPVIITIAFDMIVTSSLCIALSRLGGAGEQGALRSARQALRGILQNPMPWSIVLGAVVSALQLSLPGPVSKTIGMLADAASPAALFTIGAVLARASGGAAAGPASPRDLPAIVLLKLLLHPLLVLGIATAAAAAGLALAPSVLVAVVLVAALPSASNVSMLAERFGADSGRIARIILWTTVAAFFSFPAWVAAMRS